nr:DUF1849 family protein [Jiella sp. LLJ827]
MPVLAEESVRLVPHRAAYDLALEEASDAMAAVDGRIAIEMARTDCEAQDIDYRFVARFVQDQEMIVTDQQIKMREALDGSTLDFDAKTFVDTISDNVIKGRAETKGETTVVRYSQPTEREVEIPRSLYPLDHTRAIIAAAERGDVIFQAHVFDGDAEAEKMTTTTAIITPLSDEEVRQELQAADDTAKARRDAQSGMRNEAAAADEDQAPTTTDDPATPNELETGAEPEASTDADPSAADDLADVQDERLPTEEGASRDEDASADGGVSGPDQQDGAATDAAIAEEAANPGLSLSDQLSGLKAWRVSESFYNTDSDADGLPVFESTYTLFENGVTGDQLLQFDGYSLSGKLVDLELLEGASCPAGAPAE